MYAALRNKFHLGELSVFEWGPNFVLKDFILEWEYRYFHKGNLGNSTAQVLCSHA